MIQGWKTRLIEAVEAAIARGRSQRSLGEAAGLGPNFITQLRNSGRTPQLDSVIKLAQEIDVSLRYIIFGQAMTREEEEILDILLAMTEESRRDFLAVLRRMNASSRSE